MTQIIAIIDGTLSRLEIGKETHAGRLFKLALRLPPSQRQIFYDQGVQGTGVSKWVQVSSGTGLNLSIIKTYQKLSEHYQEGDELYLFGYSRGAYAMRLIAGMIRHYGLLQSKHASLAMSEKVLNLYSQRTPNTKDKSFRSQYCRGHIPIEFLGVWETVKALGLQLPLLNRYIPFQVTFKDLKVPRNVKYARHALAINETRKMFKAELWNSAAPSTDMQQMLFAGDHAVVGGNVHYQQEARLLGNFAMIWMLEEAARAGLTLPTNWQKEFPSDPCAPDHDRTIWYDYLLLRAPRKFNPPEYFAKHPSLQARAACPKN